MSHNEVQEMVLLQEALRQCIDPYTGKDWVSGKNIRQLRANERHISLDLVLGYPAQSQYGRFREQIVTQLQLLAAGRDILVNIYTQIVSHAVQQGLKPLPGVKNILAVASGKGGVGKSTTAVNLALALQQEGARVGILDADIYGPSQPLMLGLQGEKPVSEDGKSLQPLEAHGLQVMSIGFLVEEDTPMVWRGPMATGALEQLLRDTNWHDLDYLIVDMPPGTGDIQLTLAQKVPVTGAVIVTTPQDVALLDARKGLKMFEKVRVPILGVVENMSFHVCSHCGHRDTLFGEGGGTKLEADYQVPLLGQLPLDGVIRQQTDRGQPTVMADPQGGVAEIYREIARKAAARVALQQVDYASKFPTIVVQKD